MLCLMASLTVTTASRDLARISRPALAASSARAANASARDTISVKDLFMLEISFRDELMPVPVGFQLEEHRVNPADDAKDGGFGFGGLDAFEGFLQGRHIGDGLVVDGGDEIAGGESANRSPTAFLDLRDQRAGLFLRPLLLIFVEERRVAGGELKILVTILLHFAFELRRTDQLDRQTEFI